MVIRCEKCNRILLENKVVWLELSTTDGKYYVKIPEGHKSQGAFPFGKECASGLNETSEDGWLGVYFESVSVGQTLPQLTNLHEIKRKWLSEQPTIVQQTLKRYVI